MFWGGTCSTRMLDIYAGDIDPMLDQRRLRRWSNIESMSRVCCVPTCAGYQRVSHRYTSIVVSFVACSYNSVYCGTLNIVNSLKVVFIVGNYTMKKARIMVSKITNDVYYYDS